MYLGTYSHARFWKRYIYRHAPDTDLGKVPTDLELQRLCEKTVSAVDWAVKVTHDRDAWRRLLEVMGSRPE